MRRAARMGLARREGIPVRLVCCFGGRLGRYVLMAERSGRVRGGGAARMAEDRQGIANPHIRSKALGLRRTPAPNEEEGLGGARISCWCGVSVRTLCRDGWEYGRAGLRLGKRGVRWFGVWRNGCEVSGPGRGRWFREPPLSAAQPPAGQGAGVFLQR